MFRKTDRYLKRSVNVYGAFENESKMVYEYVRRETWWIFWIIPIYSRDTIAKKPF